jgi:hypothetical protein
MCNQIGIGFNKLLSKRSASLLQIHVISQLGMGFKPLALNPLSRFMTHSSFIAARHRFQHNVRLTRSAGSSFIQPAQQF